MSFRTASIFSEVGVDFPISYKVNQLLLDRLVKKLQKENQEVNVKGEFFSLGVIVSTRKNVTDLSFQGPSISKKYKMVDYTIWMPFAKVIESDNILFAYLDYLCQGISLVMKECGYPTAAISKIFEETKKR